jgi:Ca2+:H+ antiporter
VGPLLKELRYNPMLWLLVLVRGIGSRETGPHGAHAAVHPFSARNRAACRLAWSCYQICCGKDRRYGGRVTQRDTRKLTELVIAAAALRAGEYGLVKGSIAGAIVTNTLFMLGASFFLGGLKHHVQEYNRATARLDAALLFLATIALVSPSAIARADLVPSTALTHKLSVALAVLLILGYGLGLLFSLKTHREIFASAEHAEASEPAWPIGLALVTLAVVTVLVALVSEVFVESVQKAAKTFGMSQAFVGFIVVALVGGAAEMAVAFSAARKDRLDLSVGIALGSASQIALFVRPVLVLLSYVIGPTPMDLQFWSGAVVMIFVATIVAAFITSGGRSAWFVGVLLLFVYLVFAITLYLWPPPVE